MNVACLRHALEYVSRLITDIPFRVALLTFLRCTLLFLGLFGVILFILILFIVISFVVIFHNHWNNINVYTKGFENRVQHKVGTLECPWK